MNDFFGRCLVSYLVIIVFEILVELFEARKSRKFALLVDEKFQILRLFCGEKPLYLNVCNRIKNAGLCRCAVKQALNYFDQI